MGSYYDGVPQGAVKADIATIDGIVDAILEDTGTTLDGVVDTIAADVINVDASSIPAMVGTDDAALVAGQARELYSMDFWSVPGLSVTVTATQSTITTGLNNVVVADLPSGMTVVRAIAMMKFRMVANIHATIANKLDAASALPMQVDDSGNTGMLTCLDFADDLFTLAASLREGGDVIIGDIDIKARVDGNDTYDFQWLNAKADQNNIVFHDVQMGLRIWYSV